MEKIKASFRIMGKDLDPCRVTSLLEMEPAISHSQGDPSIGKNGKRYAAFQAGLWSIESYVDEKENLNSHLLSLLARLESKVSVLQQLSDEGYKIDCFIGTFTDHSPIGFCIGYEVIKRLAQFPVELDFDIYVNESA